PGAAFVDPDLDVAAVMVAKRPAPGVAAPSAQRAFEEQNVIGALGAVTNRHTRALTTVQGFDAEQATFVLRGRGSNTARGIASTLASAFLGGVALTGTPPAGGTPGSDMVIQLLTIYRSPSQVVLLAAVAIGSPPSDDALIRMDEFTDGTNVARHG